MMQQTIEPGEGQSESANVASPHHAEAKAPQPYRLSLLGLMVAIVSVGLAVIPPIAYGKPLNFFGRNEKEPVRTAPPSPEREGGVTFKIKSFSVNVGGKVKESEPLPEPKAKLTQDPVEWLNIAGIGLALSALVISSLGHVKERHTSFTATSMACCTLAITWQYFAIGIILGAAAVVAIIVLCALYG